MWTDKNAKDIRKLTKTFRPSNRFVLPEFSKHCAEHGRPKLFEKFKASLANKLAGWHALEMAGKGHTCLCCQSKILPSICRVCPECLGTSKGKRISIDNNVKERAAACIKKYGVSNPMLAKEVKRKHQKAIDRVFGDQASVKTILRKRRKTSRETYGTDYPQQSSEVRKTLSASTQASWDDPEVKKARLKKGRKTNREIYGVDHYMQNDAVQRKHRSTLFKKYGHVNAAWGDEPCKKKMATFRRKFGVAHPMQNAEVLKKRRKTTFQRYGVQHPMQVPSIRKRAFETAKKLTPIKYKGKTFLCQGYEKYVLPRLADKFGVENVIGQFDEEFKPLKFKGRVYTPDFYIKSNDTYVEVKSSFTLYGKIGNSNFLRQNKSLQEQASNRGIKLKFIVYNEVKDRCTVLPSTWCDMSRKDLKQNLG